MFSAPPRALPDAAQALAPGAIVKCQRLEFVSTPANYLLLTTAGDDATIEQSEAD